MTTAFSPVRGVLDGTGRQVQDRVARTPQIGGDRRSCVVRSDPDAGPGPGDDCMGADEMDGRRLWSLSVPASHGLQVGREPCPVDRDRCREGLSGHSCERCRDGRRGGEVRSQLRAGDGPPLGADRQSSRGRDELSHCGDCGGPSHAADRDPVDRGALRELACGEGGEDLVDSGGALAVARCDHTEVVGRGRRQPGQRHRHRLRSGGGRERGDGSAEPVVGRRPVLDEVADGGAARVDQRGRLRDGGADERRAFGVRDRQPSGRGQGRIGRGAGVRHGSARRAETERSGRECGDQCQCGQSHRPHGTRR